LRIKHPATYREMKQQHVDMTQYVPYGHSEQAHVDSIMEALVRG